MDTKLTLKLDKTVINRAKAYAAAHNRSLSKVIESYLKSLTDLSPEINEDKYELSDFVKKMATGVSIPADLDHKNERGTMLSEKYR